ncbi:MAG: quinone-dependent dihydroorotate dehydrogenase [Rhodospirillales bacterium]|nr:quinone-dependent dihydroorotate dehydrogenase [Rhodospirillales bacterium]
MLDYFALAGPLIRAIEAERAHAATIAALRLGLVPRRNAANDPVLSQDVWGIAFANPVGLAAGFDKNAEVCDAMLAQGFGFVEIGTVTPRPQAGNPQPRLFRLEKDGAVINRMGFNNQGLAQVAARLSRRRYRHHAGIVGGNVGPNRDAADPAADCAIAVRTLAPLVDYLVINVSSPNTPGLRSLQRRSALARLLQRVGEARADVAAIRTPLLVKVAPDLEAEELADIAEVVMAAGVDGVVATNTTIARPPELSGRARDEVGGLSGTPLFRESTRVLADLYRLTGGRLPLIGVGGIGSGRDAYAKIRAGASLVQIYTALVYQGPALIGRVNAELARLVRRDGFSRLADAVGADVRGGDLKAETAL